MTLFSEISQQIPPPLSIVQKAVCSAFKCLQIYE